MSEADLGRYCTEFDFRYNTRSTSDAECADIALLGAIGKRLTLRRTDVTGAVMLEEPSTKRLAHIGALCLQWSYLEYVIGAIIWKLLNLDIGVGTIVTGGLDLLPRINMAINLCREMKADTCVVG
jgi:hypothetical protein